MSAAQQQVNDNLILISGESGTGKSASLMNLRDQKGVMYLNCEAGKKLPFKNGFLAKTITDPMWIEECFLHAEKLPEIHTIVVDSISFLMEMYESKYVLPAADSRAMWGEYAQYFKKLMQVLVAGSTKNVILITHTSESLDEAKGLRKTQAVVKGALAKTGLEAYFSLNVAVKKMSLTDLEPYLNEHLTITEDDLLVGYKHVFQTRITKNTTGERIRGPMGMFDVAHTYINNDAQMLLDIVHEYYKDE